MTAENQSERKDRVICWQLSEDLVGQRLPPRSGMAEGLQLVYVDEPELLLTELGTPGDAVLLLDGLDPLAAELVGNLHEQSDWSSLPVFVRIGQEELSDDIRKSAGELRADILALPKCADSFWSRIQEACLQYRGQIEQTRAGLRLRRHRRVTLAVTAFCSVEAQTVDLSAGGLQFQTNHFFFPGDHGEINLPALDESLGAAFPFQVVKAETQRGNFRFVVRARFVGLGDETIQKLVQSLKVLEPENDGS